MSTCTKRAFRKFQWLKRYFELLDPEMRNAVNTRLRHNNLINPFDHPSVDELLRFLDTALPHWYSWNYFDDE